MKTARIAFASLLLSSAAAFAGPAVPTPVSEPPPSDSGWSYRFAPYLWALGLDGTMGVKGLEAGVDVPFSDILEDLDISLMAAFEARNGPWGITLDVQYSKLSDTTYDPGPLLEAAGFDMEQLLANVALSYRLTESNGTVVDLYGGARINWLDAEVTLTNVIGSTAAASGDETWADAIAGIRLQTPLGGSWSFRAVGDIGAGESDFTWQAMGLVVYRLSESCNLAIGYRGIGVDYEDGGFTYDITSHGPILGAEWKF